MHPLKVGVMVYFTVAGSAPLLNKVCDIVLPQLLPEQSEKPVTVVPDGVAVHVNSVPVTAPDKLMVTVFPEQMEEADGVATTLGVGWTVTSAVKGSPAHPLASGVMVYRTTPDPVPLLVRVCSMAAPQFVVHPPNPPIVAPLSCAAVHVKALPLTVELSSI